MEELDPLTLQDWRRRVSELYAATRAEPDPRRAWERWRAERDALFERHPATPLPAGARESFAGLALYDHDPAARVLADPEPAPEQAIALVGSAGATFGARRFATARFRLGGADCSLDLYWLDGYSGGLFAPFADATSGTTTYGAGRYLLDTVKGADLAHRGRPARARLQLRLQPVVRVRPELGLSARPAGQPAGDRGRGRGAGGVNGWDRFAGTWATEAYEPGWESVGPGAGRELGALAPSGVLRQGPS